MTWYNNSWNYRKAITISNSGSALSDYQILVTVDTASLVAASKMRSDCGDIRFVDTDDSTLLNYWIESVPPSSSATKIWIKVPSVPSSKTINMYYGNTVATSTSNGVNTFNGFWTWDSNLDGWTATNNYTGINPFYATDGYPSPGCLFLHPPSAWVPSLGYIDWTLTTSTYALRFYMKGQLNWDQTARFKVRNSASSWTTLYDQCILGSTWLLRGWYTYAGDINRLQFEGDSGTCYGGNAMQGEGTWFDSLIIRKYVSPEPSTSPLTEETFGSLNISSTPSGAVGASVYIDGNGTASGVTQLIVTNLAPGTHTYRLTKTGYTEISATNFTINSGQTTTVSQAMLTIASITATSMTVYSPSESPCRTGICTVGVSVTWTNNGESTGSFVPSLTFSGGTITPTYSSEPLAVGAYVVHAFTISNMTAGSHSICPNPN